MNEERLLKVLLSPHVSEKATHAAGHLPLYVFKVMRCATKNEIALAIKKLFNVEVHSVRTCRVKGKQARFGRLLGRHNHWKKAYVTLAEGSEIDLAQA